MTDLQSEQLDYDKSGDRTCDLKHRSTLTIPLSHRPCEEKDEGNESKKIRSQNRNYYLNRTSLVAAPDFISDM